MNVMTKKKTKIILRFLLVAAVIAVCFGIWNMTRPKVNSPAAVKPQSTSKSASTTDQKPTEQNSTNKTSTTTTSGAAATTPKFSLLVTRPVDGDTITTNNGLVMTTIITGATTGTCNASFTGPDGQKVTQSVPFTPQTSYSSCKITLKPSQLVVGTWTYSLQATAGDTTSNSVNQSFKVVDSQ